LDSDKAEGDSLGDELVDNEANDELLLSETASAWVGDNEDGMGKVNMEDEDEENEEADEEEAIAAEAACWMVGACTIMMGADDDEDDENAGEDDDSKEAEVVAGMAVGKAVATAALCG
jgi:hypothetical protein